MQALNKEGIYIAHWIIFLTSVADINNKQLILTLFIYSDTSSCCMGVWRVILWLDDWKRGILYIIISIPCFIEPADVWMGIISGNVSAKLYSIIQSVRRLMSQRQHKCHCPLKFFMYKKHLPHKTVYIP